MSASTPVAVALDGPREPEGPRAGWVLRAHYDRLVAAVPRVGSGLLLQLAWALSGLLVGVSVGYVLSWSAPGVLLAGLITAALTWFGRGLATVLVAAACVLAAVSAAFFLTLQAFPHAAWHMAWLLPMSLLLLVAVIVLARRVGLHDWAGARLAAGVLDLAAAVGVYLLASLCVHRAAGLSPSAILLSSEDNGAWLNTVGLLHDSHGVTALTPATVSTFGPVAEAFLAYVRELSGGVLPHAVSATQTAAVVVTAQVLLIVLSPVVAALAARRTLRYARPGLSLLSWFGSTVLLASFCLLTPIFGFYTAALALLLVVVAACLLPGLTLDPRSPRAAVGWLAAALLLYSAGSSWVPLMPLGAIALVGWYAAFAWPALAKGPWSSVRLAAVMAVPVAVLGGLLYEQYGEVISPIGGGDSLLAAGGNTPAATDVMTAVAVGLAVLGWAAHQFSGGHPRRQTQSFGTPIAWIVGYVALVTLFDGWRTLQAPHYGSVKLLYFMVGALLVLGVADLLASAAVGVRRLNVAASVVAAALFAGTVAQGPVYTAVQSHWPKGIPLPAWVATVDREVGGQSRVLCLGITAKATEEVANLDAYNCSRWAASEQGKDDPAALTWRFVQLGRKPVSEAVALLDTAQAAHQLPWRIVVVGSMASLRDPKAWWAPILRKPGRLTFVAAGA